MKPFSEKFKQQRRFFLVLPLLVLPFVTMVFWALGGGQGTEAKATSKQQKGFNTELPTAQLSSGNLDKMSLYNMAERDSQALREARRQDPYAGYLDSPINDRQTDTGIGEDNIYGPPFSGTGGDAAIQNYDDPNELKAQRKLGELEKALNSNGPDTGLFSSTGIPEPAEKGDTDTSSSQLTQLMATLQQQNHPDPELKQLDGMLEKILDIQHPGRVSEQLKAQSEKETGRVFPVTTATHTGRASLLDRPYIPPLPDSSMLPFTGDLQQNAFYVLDQPVMHQARPRQAISAVIDETQTLVSGATIKLRLLQDVYINGVPIPKNTFVFGTSEVMGERLKIQVQDIRYGQNLFPVSLSVYDMDGLEGIKVPGAIARDATKQSSAQALQSMQLMSLEPSLGEQAAGAGIEAVKGLLSKKAKLVRVTVKAGYPVLLVDKKSMQQ